MIWTQTYNPVGSATLSTVLAALMGCLVQLQATVVPFSTMVAR
jgi:hypothetical protein